MTKQYILLILAASAAFSVNAMASQSPAGTPRSPSIPGSSAPLSSPALSGRRSLTPAVVPGTPSESSSSVASTPLHYSSFPGTPQVPATPVAHDSPISMEQAQAAEDARRELRARRRQEILAQSQARADTMWERISNNPLFRLHQREED